MLKFDAGFPWRWWIVDDNGPQSAALTAVYDRLMGQEHCEIIKSTKSLGFAGANNLAFSVGSAKLVLLLNSDTRILHDGWLKAMVNEFDDVGVGIVGAKLLYFKESRDPARPGGKVQHAGVVFDMRCRPYHLFMGWDAAHPKVNQRREMNAVTGACLMIKRSLYGALGGLDEDYKQGNYEDIQLCLQVRRLMKSKVVFTPNAVLEHYAGGSDNTAAAYENEKLFYLKCKELAAVDDWKYW